MVVETECLRLLLPGSSGTFLCFVLIDDYRVGVGQCKWTFTMRIYQPISKRVDKRVVMMLCIALLKDWIPVILLTLLGSVAAIAVFLTSQAISGTSVFPTWSGLTMIYLGLLPEALGIALPISILVGGIAGASSWTDKGCWKAVYLAGLPGRTLLPALLLVGLGGGCLYGFMTHNIGPAGRSLVSGAIVTACYDLQLWPGTATNFGDVLVHVSQRDGDVFTDPFIAYDDMVWSASVGQMDQGRLHLSQGDAAGLSESNPWQISFESAYLVLPQPRLRIEPDELATGALVELISGMQVEGQPTHSQRLELYKRTTLPLSLPILAALSLPLGFVGRSRLVIGTGIMLGWWAIIRVCDQSVDVIGPWWSAVTPLAGLFCLLLWVWTRWAER